MKSAGRVGLYIKVPIERFLYKNSTIEEFMKRHSRPAPHKFLMEEAVREREVEKQLIDEVKKRGGLCEKWISGTVGWPDRIVIIPDGKIGFVEVKRPGEKPRPIQVHRHNQLRQIGVKVYVLDHPDKIGGILNDLQST